jgi:hypothetical protein
MTEIGIAARDWAEKYDGELTKDALAEAVQAGINMAQTTMANTPCGLIENYPFKCDLLNDARRLMTLALDFWSAPGIDMPDVDTFDEMVRYMEATGEPYGCKWDKEGNYLGEPITPVGLTTESFEARRIPCPVCKGDLKGHEHECPHCGGCACSQCGRPHQLVRPGKTQPDCECDD